MTGHTRAQRSRRRHRSAAGAVLAVSTVIVSGCTQIGIEPNTFESGPLPAIADEGAQGVLDAHDETLNDANAARDPELLATVVAEPLLGIETARYALDATADPEDAQPLPAVEHTDPTVFVPRFDGYPQWFVTASAVAPDTPMRLEVFGRETASAPWITPFSTELLAGVEFPELALDDLGYVVPVPTNAQALLSTTPDDLAAAHAAALSVSEDATGAVFAADAWTTARLAVDAERGVAVGEAAQVQATYEVTSVLPTVLETADGGMIIFYALTEDVVYQVQPTFFLQLDEPTAAILGTAEITTSLTERWAAQLAVYVSSDGSEARVIGARVDRIGLTGS